MDNPPNATNSPHAQHAPKWALGFGFIISSLVAGVLAFTPIMGMLSGHDALNAKISSYEDRVKGMASTIDVIVDRQTQLTLEVKKANEELQQAKVETRKLEVQLENEVSRREELTNELLKKETRIAELENMLAKLTDGKFNSINDVPKNKKVASSTR